MRPHKWTNYCYCQTLALLILWSGVTNAEDDDSSEELLYHDAHYHPTNYIQEGVTLGETLSLVGDKVGRFAVMAIPLQQKWDYFVSQERDPNYYLRSAASLYYYSFVDAVLATQYMDLSEEEKQRIDPMITGFNPTDMYARDHIERVLKTFPGVFSGIGEFSVHKEFVSAKVAGHAASLHNKALDGIFEIVAETGLVSIIHCDIDNVRPGEHFPDHYEDLKDLLRRHPGATIIWAHTGLGRYVKPSEQHVELIDALLSDEDFSHVYTDISWDLVNEYMVADESTIEEWTALFNKHPTRFLFGSDSVAPSSWEGYNKSYEIMQPIWEKLTDDTMHRLTRGNYEALFDAAIPRVRAWERAALAGE